LASADFPGSMSKIVEVDGVVTGRQPEVRIKMGNLELGASIEVLFEDEHIWVINKPSGFQSTTPRFGGPSVILSARTRSDDAHLVHRLDRDTSGVMVVGMSRWALKSLNRQFRERSVLKHYEALVRQGESELPPIIDLPLAPDRLRRPRQVMSFRRGKACQTRVLSTRVEPPESASMSSQEAHGEVRRVVLELITGARHQIRAHLAFVGSPVLGCDLYAPEAVRAGADRLMLHAARLEFDHPASGDHLRFEAPTPF